MTQQLYRNDNSFQSTSVLLNKNISYAQHVTLSKNIRNMYSEALNLPTLSQVTIDTSNPSHITPNQSIKQINPPKISQTPKHIEIYERANEAIDDPFTKKLLRIISCKSPLIQRQNSPTPTSAKKKLKVKYIGNNRNPPRDHLPEPDSTKIFNDTIQESSENSHPFVNPANGMNFTLGNFNEKEYYPANMKVQYDTMPESFKPNGLSKRGINNSSEFDFDKLTPVPEDA